MLLTDLSLDEAIYYFNYNLEAIKNLKNYDALTFNKQSKISMLKSENKFLIKNYNLK